MPFVPARLQQTVVWTALPNGRGDGGTDSDTVFASVIAMPRLVVLPRNADTATLSLFPDWVNWPSTMSSVSFAVQYDDGTPQPATLAPGAITPDNAGWQAIFDPNKVAVTPYDFADHDISQSQIVSYETMAVHDAIAALYTSTAVASPTSPIQLTYKGPGSGRDLPGFDPGANKPITDAIKAIGKGTAFPNLDRYRARQPAFGSGPFPLRPKPPVPLIDLHGAVAALAHYPQLLRRFGLVFDLVLPRPVNSNGSQVNVRILPTYTSAFPAPGRSAASSVSQNISLRTVTDIASFRPVVFDDSHGDYDNGMLNLSDDGRFSVIDLDPDIAVDRVRGLSDTIDSFSAFPGSNGDFTRRGAELETTAAVPVPALRSSGPTVVWSGYADQLSTLAAMQADLQTQLEAFDGTTDSLPLVYAEHLIRGHRFDVETTSDATPAWRSLMGRNGRYTFGPNAASGMTFIDEAISSPAATTRPGDTSTLYATERLFRWDGWSLAAQYPGAVVATADGTPTAAPNPGNAVVPDPTDPNSTQPHVPQLSATFSPPLSSGPKNIRINHYPLPRLRFGNSYRFRARGVDLAGNSLAVTESDDSTATSAITHSRYEPVVAPLPVPIAPLGPGETALSLVLLDDQVNPPTTNARWLFPPKLAQAMLERHGMFDEVVPDTSVTVLNGSAKTYAEIAERDPLLLGDVVGAEVDRGPKHDRNPTVYVPATRAATPWYPDPISAGVALLGLPGAETRPVVVPWDNGTWPTFDPIRLSLSTGSTAGYQLVTGTPSTSPTIAVTLPPGESAIVRISSGVAESSLGLLGVWQWIFNTTLPPGITREQLTELAVEGQVWMLTPFRILRLVHAVRLPTLLPAFGTPLAIRPAGATLAYIGDRRFVLDVASTSAIDVRATWADPYDDPDDPASNPADPASFHRRVSAHAFRLSVADPKPLPAEAKPLTLTPPAETFVFGVSSSDQPSAVHHVGDTKHHRVTYTATATSRFAELFEQQLSAQPLGTSPTVLSPPPFGLNANSVQIDALDGPLEAGADFTVDPDAGTVTLTSAAAARGPFDVTYQPTVTVTGPDVQLELLSTAPPAAPKIARILPAWAITRSANSAVVKGSVSVRRTGDFLRVFLERPWFTSGDGELLGVVARTGTVAPTVDNQYPGTTAMGVDPAGYHPSEGTPWPFVPSEFDHLAPVPAVPGRAYADPPTMRLAGGLVNNHVWPYPVHYDAGSRQWYADVHLAFGPLGERFPPPPGYFVRLVLTRFQPYSIAGAEFSPLATATIVQPVPDRFVSAVADPKDHKRRRLIVSVVGPAYAGWRPPTGPTALQKDSANPDSPHLHAKTKGTRGTTHTSTMLVEVQVHDTSRGLGGDFAWRTVGTPVSLRPTFSNSTVVSWGGRRQEGYVTLPDAATSHTRMRLRISEVDYRRSGVRLGASALERRPFVAFLPVN